MKKTILALALAVGLTSFAGNAKAGLTYNWSFDGIAEYPGSVAGVLTLNSENLGGNYPATSLYVTSSTSVPFNPNYNWVNGNYNNYFYVVDGLITAANFASNYNQGQSQFFINYFSVNGLADNRISDYTYNQNGLSGITLTPAAAVPEPSQVAASLLLIGGIAGFVIVRRKKALGA